MDKEPKPWKGLTSRLLLDHADLKIVEDDIELPDGSKATYIRLAPRQTDSIIIIANNSKNKVLIQREYSYPPDKIMWQLPGGSMKPGESILQAARRELAEESGQGAKRCFVLGSFYTHNRLSDQKQHVVLCTNLYDHKQVEDADEFIESYWMSKKDISKRIANGEVDNINLLAALHIWTHSKHQELKPKV